MGEVYTSGKRGGKPKQIDGFTGSMQIITETTTWTCPATGEYYISCIGQGGTHQWTYDSNNNTFGSTGGGGGIAESKLKLQKGAQIEVTINAADSSFGNYLSATGGESSKINQKYNSSAATLNKYKTSGGAGIGGTVGNYQGDEGKTRGQDMGVLQGGGTNINAKYGGASGGQILGIGDDISAGRLLVFTTCPTLSNHNMFPYGSSQSCGVYRQGESSNYGESTNLTQYIKNGAVIIEYMG